MARPPAEAPSAGLARLAIIGAQSPQGGGLRERLAEAGVPGARVDLYGSAVRDAVITEYDGEARLIQAPEPDEVAGHRVVFLCEPGEAARHLARPAGPETVVIDVCGALADDPNVPLVDPDRPLEDGGVRVWRLPQPAAVVLAEVLRPLQRNLDVSGVSAVLLTPAADHGEAGLEELRDQTVRLLSFADVPTEVFGGQLAFNLIPQRRMQARPELSARVAADTDRLLGWRAPTLALQMINVPVFQGHSVALHVRFNGDVSEDQVREALADRFDDQAAATPIEAAGERCTRVVDLAAAGDGVGLWAVAGEVEAIPAQLAVRLARQLIGE